MCYSGNTSAHDGIVKSGICQNKWQSRKIAPVFGSLECRYCISLSWNIAKDLDFRASQDFSPQFSPIGMQNDTTE
jgi:hypothetical protein